MRKRDIFVWTIWTTRLCLNTRPCQILLKMNTKGTYVASKWHLLILTYICHIETHYWPKRQQFHYNIGSPQLSRVPGISAAWAWRSSWGGPQRGRHWSLCWQTDSSGLESASGPNRCSWSLSGCLDGEFLSSSAEIFQGGKKNGK